MSSLRRSAARRLAAGACKRYRELTKEGEIDTDAFVQWLESACVDVTTLQKRHDVVAQLVTHVAAHVESDSSEELAAVAKTLSHFQTHQSTLHALLTRSRSVEQGDQTSLQVMHSSQSNRAILISAGSGNTGIRGAARVDPAAGDTAEGQSASESDASGPNIPDPIEGVV